MANISFLDSFNLSVGKLYAVFLPTQFLEMDEVLSLRPATQVEL